MSNIDRITSLVYQFADKHRFSVLIHQHSVAELRGRDQVPDQFWATFEKHPGTYIIADPLSSSVRYIGMSTVDTGSRMFNWMYKDNKVSKGVQETDTVVSVVTADHNYMAPALELYLIQELSPSLNTTGNYRRQS